MGSQELITRTTIAALRIQNVQLTNRWKIPAVPSCAASIDLTTSSRTMSTSVKSSIPPITTTTSAHNGAAAGVPPARTTFRSIGEMIGSTVERQKRATALKGLIFLVRTAQSSTQIAPNTTPIDNSAGRRIWITTSVLARNVSIYRSVGLMCSSFTRNANLSAASSISLLVGLTAPCPAFVSVLTRHGLALLSAACTLATYLQQ